MKKKLFLCLIIGFFIFGCVRKVKNDGNFLPPEHTLMQKRTIEDLVLQKLRKKYLLTPDPQQPTEQEVDTYIKSIWKQTDISIHQESSGASRDSGKSDTIPHLISNDSRSLARLIVNSGKCLGLDVFIFTALIREESAFGHSVDSEGQLKPIVNVKNHMVQAVKRLLGKNTDKKLELIVYDEEFGGYIGSGVLTKATVSVPVYFKNSFQRCMNKTVNWDGKSQDVSQMIMYSALFFKYLLLLFDDNEKQYGEIYFKALYHYSNNKSLAYFGPQYGELQAREYFRQVIMYSHVRGITTSRRPKGLVIYPGTNNVALCPIYCKENDCKDLYFVTEDSLLVRCSPISRGGKLGSTIDLNTTQKLTLWSEQLVIVKEIKKVGVGHQLSRWGKIVLKSPDDSWNFLDCDDNRWVNMRHLKPVSGSHLDFSH